jgi:hypothetical protein
MPMHAIKLLKKNYSLWPVSLGPVLLSFLQSNQVPMTVAAVNTTVTKKYSHSHQEYTEPWGPTLKSKKDVLKNV